MSKKTTHVNGKQAMPMSEFLKNYCYIDCKTVDTYYNLTHAEVETVVQENHGIKLNKVRFDRASKEDLLRGNIIYVKDCKKKVVLYKRPQCLLTTKMDLIQRRENNVARLENREAITFSDKELLGQILEDPMIYANYNDRYTPSQAAAIAKRKNRQKEKRRERKNEENQRR